MIKFRFVSLLFFLLNFHFSESQEIIKKKKLTDKEFRYEFFVTEKNREYKDGRLYFWFKSGGIHFTEGSSSGELLDGIFEKFYFNNQLAEKGLFNRGLKEGEWKAWHANGKLKEINYWSSGRKNGNFFMYDETGKLLQTGNFTKDRKHGKWIDFEKKDTLTYFRGELVVKKLTTKDSLRLESKKIRKKNREEEKKLKKVNKEQKKQPVKSQVKIQKEKKVNRSKEAKN